MECKLLHCEYKASEGANYQNMSLQCIMFSGLACSQHAIKLILVSNEADLKVDSNDSSQMCISRKTKKLLSYYKVQVNVKRVQFSLNIICMQAIS